MFGKIAPLTRMEAAHLALISGLIFISVYVAIQSMTLSAGQMAIWPSDGIALAMMLGRFRHRPLMIVLLTEAFSGLPGVFMNDNLIFIILLKIPDSIFLVSLGYILKNTTTSTIYIKQKI